MSALTNFLIISVVATVLATILLQAGLFDGVTERLRMAKQTVEQETKEKILQKVESV